MEPSNRKRGKVTGRSASGPAFLKLPHWIIESEQFAQLTGSEVKLLIDIAAQFKGRNNGNLSIEEIRHRWKSRTTTQAAKDGLLQKEWIIRTRRGGLRMGPDLFAVTWLPIDECKGKHNHAPETRASHAWSKKKSPDQNLELVVPETGTGKGQKVEKRPVLVPETGTVEANFRAF
jgi:hypothetical protein